MRVVRFHGEPPVYLTFPALGALGLPHAVTTRHCPDTGAPSRGAGPLSAAAARVLVGAALDLGTLAYARQVHGADVAQVTSGGFAGTADILVTRAPSTPLAIVTADCLAVTVWDPAVPVLALAHVGWRGTTRGAARRAVSAATALGGRTERLCATIGPSIGPCCYEVDERVLREFETTYGETSAAWFTPVRPDHWMLDLWKANEDLLAGAGVARERIENARLCTACHSNLFYSYRRGDRGRIVTIASLP